MKVSGFSWVRVSASYDEEGETYIAEVPGGVVIRYAARDTPDHVHVPTTIASSMVFVPWARVIVGDDGSIGLEADGRREG